MLTCKQDNLMLLAGMNATVSGQETLFAFSPSNQDGFTSLLTLFNSTTWCQDSRANSQGTLPAGLTGTTPHWTTGSMKDQIKNQPGTYPRDSGDGWNGTMVLMLCLLIKVKLDGTTFQTEVSMLSATPGMVSSPQSMSITTTSTLEPTSNLEKQEVLRVLTQDSSCQRVNSLTSQSGENESQDIQIYFI